MSLKKSLSNFLAIASIGVVLLGIAQLFDIKPPAIISFHSSPKNSISGRDGADGPVIAVKIDDTQGARPQAGLESADLVYIEQVEGGLTRLAAIYSSSIPEIVGPVRSARISDIELLAQYGKIAFAYSGVQKKMVPVVAAANLYDVGANKYGPTFYANDLLRTPPYAMMLNSQLLMKKVLDSGISLAISKNMGWEFGDQDLSQAQSIKDAHFSWPASSYDISWNGQHWMLSHLGTPDFNADGEQLFADTFIAQIVSISDSIYHDKVGGVTPFSATVGSGEAFIFRDGKVLKGQWNRPSEDTGTTFTTAAGEKIKMKPGRIWIALLSKAPTVRLVSADAASATTK